MVRLNVSYPFTGNFTHDEDVDRAVGVPCVGSGCGSFMLSFAKADSGTWRDREYHIETKATAQEVIEEIATALKDEFPGVDWRVNEMPKLEEEDDEPALGA